MLAKLVECLYVMKVKEIETFKCYLHHSYVLQMCTVKIVEALDTFKFLHL